MFTFKIFYFRYDSRAKLKTDLYFVKLIIQKVSYIHLKSILAAANDPLLRMSKKVEFSIAEGGCQFTVLMILF